MKIGKIELTQEKLIIVAAAAIAITALALYGVFYMPLMKELRVKYLECSSIEGDAMDARNTIETAGRVYGHRILPTEEEVHSTIDELTEYGSKIEGINFVSINPKEIKKEKDAEYKIMPIEMGVESSYRQLGVFLGSLDDMEKGLVKVKSFDITPDKEDPSKLTTGLAVEIYLSGDRNESR